MAFTKKCTDVFLFTCLSMYKYWLRLIGTFKIILSEKQGRKCQLKLCKLPHPASFHFAPVTYGEIKSKTKSYKFALLPGESKITLFWESFRNSLCIEEWFSEIQQGTLWFISFGGAGGHIIDPRTWLHLFTTRRSSPGPHKIVFCITARHQSV